MAEGETRRRGAQIMLQNLVVGTTVKLRNGATGQVSANPRDGSWIYLRYLSSPEASEVGTEGLVFADVVSEVLDEP